MESRGFSEEDKILAHKMKELCRYPSSKRQDSGLLEVLQDQFEQVSIGCTSSSFSRDGMSSEALSLSFGPSEHGHGDDASSCTDGSSPLTWIPSRSDQLFSAVSKPAGSLYCATVWPEKGERELSEVDLMKEKFSKLLLGEDMSGGGKGVCSALAISNAITNLSASFFGEIWRLEPLSPKHKAMWKREIDWLVSIADHIVELVPSSQTFPDGSSFEVMISRTRLDLQVNLPALRKLDAMLLESLDRFSESEFWYVDQGAAYDNFEGGGARVSCQRNEEKWWLPTPKVPVNGLSESERKKLQDQKDCINQILKAALAINAQVLSEMEIPDVYWNALPKNGKAGLGEVMYRNMLSESFSPDAFLATCDLSSEHKTIELANRIEAVMHKWRRGRQPRAPHRSSRDLRQNPRNSWGGMVKEFVSDVERREFLAERAEGVLLCLKQRFPGLRQSLLDMTKIQYNKDVGQAILECYARVMESLASNIIARIDDILYVDDVTRRTLPPPPAMAGAKSGSGSQKRRYSLNVSILEAPYGLQLKTCDSPTLSPTQRTPNSPEEASQGFELLTDQIGYGYEVKPQGKYGREGVKKVAIVQQGKVVVPSRGISGSRSMTVHPVLDD